METYRTCTIEKFNEAMKTIKEKPLNEISTDLLYIAFTKYRSDIMQLGYAAHSTYIHGLYMDSKKKMDELGTELERRGVRIMY